MYFVCVIPSGEIIFECEDCVADIRYTSLQLTLATYAATIIRLPSGRQSRRTLRLGCVIPEVTLPVDRATTVFYTCFVDFLPSIFYRFDILSAFLIAEKDGKMISAAKRHVRPEVTSPFDSLTPIWYRSVLEFFVHLSPFSSYSTFWIGMQNALRKFP
jgi:hypothetical protein